METKRIAAKRKKIVSRGWLRPANSSGPMSSFQWDVENTSFTRDSGKRSPSIDAAFTLRDCDEQVSFSFYASKPRHVYKNLLVIDKLINELTKLRVAYVKMTDEEFTDA